MALRYTIVPVAEVTAAMYTVAVESADTVRQNLAGTEIPLKWEGADPAVFDKYPKYDHADILTVLLGGVWQVAEE